MEIELIRQALHKLEEENNFKILYACESGSRAWGFESPDSDFDVRFIYKKEHDFYLTIDEPKDTFEAPIGEDLLDFSGWDIKKTLKLFKISNPNLCEWLISQIVYQKDEKFFEQITSLLADYFCPKALLNHYLGLCRRFMPLTEKDKPRLKDYFYLLRSIMAGIWLREKKSLPPVQFNELFSFSNPETGIAHIINDLKAQKIVSSEAFKVDSNSELNSWIKKEYARCLAFIETIEKRKTESGPLNKLFQETVKC